MFEDQTLSGFIEAKIAASELLYAEGAKTRGEVSFEEALTMQAIADILTTRETFYGLAILRAINRKSGTVYPILRKFELPYGLTTGSYEDETKARSNNRPRRHEYRSTEFGKTVFELFVRTK